MGRETISIEVAEKLAKVAGVSGDVESSIILSDWQDAGLIEQRFGIALGLVECIQEAKPMNIEDALLDLRNANPPRLVLEKLLAADRAEQAEKTAALREAHEGLIHGTMVILTLRKAVAPKVYCEECSMLKTECECE